LAEKSDGTLGKNETSFVAARQKNVIISTFKKAEYDNDYVLRCFDMEGSGAQAEIEVFRPISTLLETNIIEEEGKDITARVNGKTFTSAVEPYGIHTHKLIFK